MKLAEMEDKIKAKKSQHASLPEVWERIMCEIPYAAALANMPYRCRMTIWHWTKFGGKTARWCFRKRWYRVGVFFSDQPLEYLRLAQFRENMMPGGGKGIR